MPRVLLLAAVVVTFLLLCAPAAGAHTALVASEPASGATVTSLDRVVLRFAEPVDPAGTHVWLEEPGARVVPLSLTGLPGGDDASIALAVPRIPAGTYTVGWHVVATDGDALAGSFPITLAGAAAPEAPAAPQPVHAAPARSVPTHQHHGNDLPAATARVLLDTSLATLIGGLAFVAAVWPQGAGSAGTRRLLWAAALTAAVASLVLAVLQHAAAEDLSVVQALSPGHLRESLHYRFGRVAVARLVLLFALGLLTSRLNRGGPRAARSVTWCAAAAALALGLFETVALLGHSGRPGGLDAVARLVHTLGVSVWLGGLVMLFVVVLPRRRRDELVDVLPRFSVVATAAVAALVTAGILLSVDLVGAAGALPTTAYGRVLLLKLATVATLLVAAARSRRHARHRIVTASPRAPIAAPIVRWVGVELGLMVVVLALTALLVAQAPPR